MKANTTTTAKKSAAQEYTEQLHKAKLDLQDAIDQKVTTYHRVLAQETEVKNLELQLADARRKLAAFKRAEKLAARAWTNADNRVKCFETELLMKQPTFSKIDEWVNQLQKEANQRGSEIVITREYAIERRLTAEDLMDYHTFLQAKTSLFLIRPAFNAYTTKMLANDIIRMLEREEHEAVFSCSINPKPTAPITPLTESEYDIECGF